MVPIKYLRVYVLSVMPACPLCFLCALCGLCPPDPTTDHGRPPPRFGPGWLGPCALRGATAHHLAVLLDEQVGVVRGEDGGVRAREALEGVEAVLA